MKTYFCNKGGWLWCA